MFLFQVHLVTLYFRREKAQNALSVWGGEGVFVVRKHCYKISDSGNLSEDWKMMSCSHVQ